MTEPMQFLVLGLGIGAIYVLLAQGMVLIYRGSGVLNLAQGALALVGASVYIETQDNVPLVVAIGAAIVASALVGVVVNLLVMSPLRQASSITRLIATLAVMILIEQAAFLRYGSVSRFFDSYLPSGTLVVADVKMGYDRLVLLSIAIVLTVVLWVVYRSTTFGLVTSATNEDENSTALLGHSPKLTATLNWAIGSALAGAVGALIVPITGFVPSALTLLVIPAVAAALIGGFSSFPLTLAGGLGLGIATSELVRYVRTPGWSQAAPFVAIIMMLVLRGKALPVRGFVRERLPAVGSGQIPPILLPVAAILAGASVYVFSASWADAMTTTTTIAIIALSIVLVAGYAGQLSLAQFAFAGIGALVSSRVADVFGLPFPLAFVVGVAAAVPVGILVGLPALRTRGVSLAISTLGLSLVIEKLVLANPNYTGGAVRGTVVDEPSFFGWNIEAVPHPERYALVCIGVFVVAGLGVANLRRGRAGRRLIATRSNERAAASLGISVRSAKLTAFAMSAGIAGAAGVLMAFRHTHVQFDEYNAMQSINVILYSTLGGIGFAAGSIVGGLAGPNSLFLIVLSHGVEVRRFVALAASALVLVALVLHPSGFAHDVAAARAGIMKRIRRVTHRERTTREVLPEDRATARVQPARLTLSNLGVRFGGVIAVRDVAFAVEPGEVVGLIGPNGAGKTTVIDAATGFVRYSGSVSVGGQCVDGWSVARRARLGLSRSFQSLELFEELSVADNLRVAVDDRDPLAFVRDMVWPKRTPLTPTAVAAVHEFGLARYLDDQVDSLPYGVRRLVAIARVVASAPSVLLLDEPAAGLNGHETAELGRLVRRLASEWGIAVLLVEHDMSIVMSSCDRVVALEFGSKIGEGAPDDVQRDPDVIRAYLGTDESDIEVADVGQVPSLATQ